MTSGTDGARLHADQREHRLQKLEAARTGHVLPYRYPTDSTAAGTNTGAGTKTDAVPRKLSSFRPRIS